MQQEINKEDIILIPQGENRIFPCIAKWQDKYQIVPGLIKGIEAEYYMMYITDKNAPIKGGEFYYDETLGTIICATATDAYIHETKDQRMIKWAKVIGSNDKLLISDGVPSISPEFIQQWVNAINSGKEFKVMMEIENGCGDPLCVIPMRCRQQGKPTICQMGEGKEIPKLLNNQLILSIVEEKQVDDYLKGFEHGRADAYDEIATKAHSPEDSEISDAIKLLTSKGYKVIKDRKVYKKNWNSRTREYRIWSNMKQRCTNPNHKDYKHYGARGIKISEEFLSHPVFTEYIKTIENYDKWKEGDYYSLDRINNDGNYERGNLKFSTREQQVLNTRMSTKNKSGYRCVFFKRQLGKWEANINVQKKRTHIGYYNTPKEAAIAYNEYIKQHRLPNQLNVIDND